MKTVEIGRLGEDIAVKFLKNNNYRIIDRNVHVSHNEIDIIAKDKNYIVFVEVKTRSTDENMELRFGTPAAAVDRCKQKRTVDAARAYLTNAKFADLQPRLDVIEVFIHKKTHKLIKINHIENAFGA